MFKNLKISQQALILIFVPLLVEMMFISALAYQVHELHLLLDKVNQSRQFGSALNAFVDDITQIARMTDEIKEHERSSAEIGPEYFANLRQRIGKIESEVDDLSKTAPNEDMRNRVMAVADPLNKIGRVISLACDAYDQGGALSLYALMRGHDANHSKKFGKLRTSMFEGLTGMLAAKHDQQLDFDTKIAAQEAALKRLPIIVGVGAFANLIMAIILWIGFSRGTAESFRILVDNTRRLALGMPLNPPIPGKGEIPHLDRVFNDMAQALAAARRKERAIIENAIDVICSFDAEQKFNAASPACEQLFGYSPSEMVERSMRDIIYDEDWKNCEEFIRKVRTEQQRGQFETRIKRRDGTLVDALWAVQWSPAEQTMFCVAHDITERKEIERMKQEFVAMISHDLRTPLTSVQACLTLLTTGMYGDLNEQGTESVNTAETNVTRLISLINDLLDIEKMESGKLKLELGPTDLKDVFQRSVGAVIGFAEQQHVKLIANPTELQAIADGDRLVQVLVNLISNAIKFSPPNATVTLDAADHPDYIEISVSDQGRGIPPEFIDSVFERFSQVKKSDAKVKGQGGSGLGLAICKTIIEGHNGTIGVNSEEGKGSTFWFRVPKQATLTVQSKEELVHEPA